MFIIKKFITESLGTALTNLPFSILTKTQKKKLILPLYHVVSNDIIPHIIHTNSYCSVQQFEKDLDFLQKYFNPISLNDLFNNIKNNEGLPDKSFLLTFDDGYREIFEVIVPILRKRSIPAVFFLNSAFIDNKEMFYRNKASLIIEKLKTTTKNPISELAKLLTLNTPNLSGIIQAILSVSYKTRPILDSIAEIIDIDFNDYLKEKQPYLNRNEIKELINQGYMIGSHSTDHPLFQELTYEEQLNQIVNCKNMLHGLFALNYSAFAFPHHDRGISMEFYSKTHFNGLIDVSFGTSDFLKGKCPNNFQRQPMERGEHHAEQIYKRLFSHELLTNINKIRISKILDS